MQQRQTLWTLITAIGLLWATATPSHGLSLEDQILKRTGQPVYMKDGSTCDCERFWWLILAADFIQCDKGDRAEDIPVSEVDLDRTFGPGTAERVERLRAGEPPEPPETVQIEPAASGGDGVGPVPREPSQSAAPSRSKRTVDFDEIGKRLGSSDAEVLAEALLELRYDAGNPAARPLIPRLTALLDDERRVSYSVVRTGLQGAFFEGEGNIAELALSCLELMGGPGAEALHRELDRSPGAKGVDRIYWTLSRMREEGSWPWMVEGLGRKSDGVRVAAARYFREMKDPRALPLLEEAFQGSAPVRRAVVEALGGIGDARAVAFLKRVLENDEDHTVRSRAARALGDIGDPSATEALVRASRQESNRPARGNDVQNAVQHALEKTADAGSLEALVRALEDRNGPTRVAAARSLARLRDPEAAQPLARALLNDGEDEVRSWAARGLSDLQGGIARSALIEALDREPVADIRRIVVLCLHKHRQPDTVEALAGAVRQDRDPKVRMEAVKALVRMGDLGRRRADALRYAADNDAVPYNRKTAASLLRQLGW